MVEVATWQKSLLKSAFVDTVVNVQSVVVTGAILSVI